MWDVLQESKLLEGKKDASNIAEYEVIKINPILVPQF